MARLEVNNLAASYANNNGREILHAVTFALDGGQALLVHGHNGSGKSTLLKVLAGLVPVASGSVTWEGHRVKNPPPGSPVHPWAALQMQAESIFGGLSVRDNIELVILQHDESAGHRGRATKVFPLVQQFWHKRAGLLSGGERKMLALAMAVLRDAPLLLLDEPLAGLGDENASAVLSYLQSRKAAGDTLLIVEHSLRGRWGELIDLHAEMAEGRLMPLLKVRANNILKEAVQ